MKKREAPSRWPLLALLDAMFFVPTCRIEFHADGRIFAHDDEGSGHHVLVTRSAQSLDCEDVNRAFATLARLKERESKGYRKG